MERYKVYGVEEVLDEFDSFECYKPCNPMEIKAHDLDNAKWVGYLALQEVISRYRSEGGFMSKGTFTAFVTKIESIDGKVIFEENPPRSGSC